MSTKDKVGQRSSRTSRFRRDARCTEPLAVPGRLAGGRQRRKNDLGGVIYFAWTDSVRDLVKITGLSNGSKRAAMAGCADRRTVGQLTRSRGVVTWIGRLANQSSWSMARRLRSMPYAGTAAVIDWAGKLKAMGINVDYARTWDVNVNPLKPVIGHPVVLRTWSARWSRRGQGLREGTPGPSLCRRDFPGHGRDCDDSDTGRPVIMHTVPSGKQTDARPFRAAISVVRHDDERRPGGAAPNLRRPGDVSRS